MAYIDGFVIAVATANKQAFIDHAREDGRCGCILTCKEYLLHYYARFGFKNLGVSLSKHGGAVWYDMILEFSR